jgi:hypothetical protein
MTAKMIPGNDITINSRIISYYQSSFCVFNNKPEIQTPKPDQTMNSPIRILCITFAFVLLLGSCESTGNDKSDIKHQVLNKEYVFIRDVNLLQQSDDPVSEHIDSIISGLIDAEFISTGRKDFGLDDDPGSDIGFEIIDLNKFNPQGLPESFDSLAARVIPLETEILDNSTYGYPDALEGGDLISEAGHWTDRTGVLGTFMNAGQFQGMGERFLGIRLQGQDGYRYGWIRVFCSQHNDTLRIIDYAYNRFPDNSILAGQKE